MSAGRAEWRMRPPRRITITGPDGGEIVFEGEVQQVEMAVDHTDRISITIELHGKTAWRTAQQIRDAAQP